MLTAVCFDLMGVLVTDPYREALEAGTGLPLDELLPLKDPDAWPDFETAAIDEAAFVRRFWAEDAQGRRFDLDAFHEARRAGYRWLPGMRELLTELDARVERYVASNYPVWVEEVRATFGLDDLTEGVWASHHLGARKPDPEFFTRLLDKIGHDAGDCLFVDDREGNCEAAEAAGLRAHLFGDAGDLRRRLRAEGVEV